MNWKSALIICYCYVIMAGIYKDSGYAIAAGLFYIATVIIKNGADHD